MTNVIADNQDIAEALGWMDDPEAEVANITATDGPTSDRLQFHVQMHGWTLDQMETLVVEAAARQIVSKLMAGDIGKQIQSATAQMVAEKINAKLEPITAEIINQPVMVAGKTAGTLADLIGLTANAYLSESVNSEGKSKGEVGGDSWSFRHSAKRIEWIATRHMERKFKDEISTATNAAVREIQGAVKAQHLALIEEEKARIKAALEKAVSA